LCVTPMLPKNTYPDDDRKKLLPLISIYLFVDLKYWYDKSPNTTSNEPVSDLSEMI